MVPAQHDDGERGAWEAAQVRSADEAARPTKHALAIEVFTPMKSIPRAQTLGIEAPDALFCILADMKPAIRAPDRIDADPLNTEPNAYHPRRGEPLR